MTQLALYESAKEALAEALRVDEVLSVRDTAERMRLYGRQAKDKRIIADATALMLRAERKLGVLLISAKETGELGIGRPGKSNLGRNVENGTETEPFQRATLKDVGIDKKLSASSQRWAKLGDGEFEEHLQKVRDRIESDGAVVVNPMKDLSTSEKKARRATREAELGKKQAALPEAKFGVILTDDEWEHRPWSDAGLGKAAANHYPVSNLDELKKRDVASLAAPDAVLWMWTTVPHLDQAIELMAHRGFTYKTSAVWRKIYPGNGHGMGYWFWIDHEILLVGTRGNPPAPAPGTQWHSVIEAPVGEHSAKPEIFYELIESYFPTLPKIELNARQAREGWVRWGLEAPPAQPEGNLSGGEISAHQGHESYARMATEAPEQDSQAKASEDNSVSSAAQAVQSATGQGPDADGQGDASRPKPGAAEPSAPFRFTPADDAVLRAAYALPIEQFDLGIVAATIGCTKPQAKKRASHLKLGSRERQRAKARAYTAGQHERGEL